MFDVNYDIKILVLPLPPCKVVTLSPTLQNETDLHSKVVQYIRSRYPYANLVPGLGEYQTTPFKRLDGYKKGYGRGQPDLIILNRNHEHAGLAFEFKSPTGRGVLKPDQRIWLEKLARQNFKCFVSNNFYECRRQIDLYFGTSQELCPVCREWLTVEAPAEHTCDFAPPAVVLQSERGRVPLGSPSTLAISIPTATPQLAIADLLQSVPYASYAACETDQT